LADNGVEKFFYTARGLTNYTDQLTNITQFYYNEASWLAKQVFLTSASTPVETNRFEYHPSGDLLRLYDGKNQLTSWNYDEYGRVTNKVDAANVTNFVYKYDANDRLTNRTDALSRQTTNKYDGERHERRLSGFHQQVRL
jgi:YD repeat-containing protein